MQQNGAWKWFKGSVFKCPLQKKLFYATVLRRRRLYIYSTIFLRGTITVLYIHTGDNHVTCGQSSKPDVATLSYRRSHY